MSEKYALTAFQKCSCLCNLMLLIVVTLQMFCRNICDVHGWTHISQPGILHLLHNTCIIKDKNIFMKTTRLKGGEFIGYSQNISFLEG